MPIHYIRNGIGKPLLLIHGLGGSHRSWNTIIDGLSATRDIIAIDLPGFGATPPPSGEVSISTLADAVTSFLSENNLIGIDAVGSSMGARLVLELARRGKILGAVISLDPGGFWQGWQRHFFFVSIAISIRLVRLLQVPMPVITKSRLGRSLLFAQFSPHPKKLSSGAVLDEMRDYAVAKSFDKLLKNLAYGEAQKGAPKGTITKPLIIGWGKKDRVCFPSQSVKALQLFPDAKLHWFDECGHFPHWDKPEETIRLILEVTSL